MEASTKVAYDLEGSLLEACDCGTLCPCWIGEDPDGGTCQAVVAYHFDRGEIVGVDVGGLSFVGVAFIPGNILEGNFTQVIFIDDNASEEQEQAMLDAFTGKLGGPLADLAELVGEVKEVKRAPISHQISEGNGTLRIGDGTVFAEMEPYRGPDGTETTLHNSIFSTVPGSPAYVGKASKYSVDVPEHGMTWSFEGRNAIQSDWKLVHAG
jgi:hypothetical protein